MLTVDSDPSEVRGKWDGPRRTEICTCGHQQGKHIVLDRGTLCDGARGTCRCRGWAPAIKVPDVRVFMFGPGADGHPLILGMLKTKERGRYEEIEILEPLCVVEDCHRHWKTAVYQDEGRRSLLVCESHGAIRSQA